MSWFQRADPQCIVAVSVVIPSEILIEVGRNSELKDNIGFLGLGMISGGMIWVVNQPKGLRFQMVDSSVAGQNVENVVRATLSPA